MSMEKSVRRELRVAFSRKTQPVWFRVVKWLLFIGFSVLLWFTPYFWWWILGMIGLSLSVHFIWRWKTQGWTRPWRGWKDVEAARQD
jgi:hypothetical protein